MRRPAIALLAGILPFLALAFTPAWGKVVVIYPKDGTAVPEASITLLGAVDTAGGTASLTLNGQPLAPVVKPNGVFSLSLKLQPGLNLLETEGKTVRVAFLGKGQPLPIGFVERHLHDPVLEDCANCHGLARRGDFSVSDKGSALCLNCHDDPTLGKDKKRKPVVHEPLSGGGDCLACHDPHVGDTRGMSLKPLPALCYECHDEVAGKAHDHPPAAAGDCVACHDPHAATYARLLRVTGQALCLKCHKDPSADPQKPARNMPFLHGALDEGCLTCHHPHGSATKGVLRKPQVTLCWDCHDQGQAGQKKGVIVHSPIRDDKECTTCHRPHSGNLPKLLTAEAPGLCADCHEVGGKPPAGGVAHAPVTNGNCLLCHSPHAGPGRMFLKPETEVCLTCHPRMPAIPGGSNHPPVWDGECLSCHFGHSGPKGLLRKKGPALCLECHDDVTLKRDGKKYPVIHPPAEEGSCLDCHKPHYSPAPKLLAERGNSLCMTCHDDPGLTPAKGIWLSAHPPVGKNCLQCHSAHGSEEEGMLRNNPFNLCGGCHRSHKAHSLNAERFIEERKGGMVSLPETFPLTPSGRMVCTGCHLAHGGPNPSLLVDPKDKVCLMCHPSK